VPRVAGIGIQSGVAAGIDRHVHPCRLPWQRLQYREVPFDQCNHLLDTSAAVDRQEGKIARLCPPLNIPCHQNVAFDQIDQRSLRITGFLKARRIPPQTRVSQELRGRNQPDCLPGAAQYRSDTIGKKPGAFGYDHPSRRQRQQILDHQSKALGPRLDDVPCHLLGRPLYPALVHAHLDKRHQGCKLFQFPLKPCHVIRLMQIVAIHPHRIPASQCTSQSRLSGSRRAANPQHTRERLLQIIRARRW